jgi:hypothetical protein
MLGEGRKAQRSRPEHPGLMQQEKITAVAGEEYRIQLDSGEELLRVVGQLLLETMRCRRRVTQPAESGRDVDGRVVIRVKRGHGSYSALAARRASMISACF